MKAFGAGALRIARTPGLLLFGPPLEIALAIGSAVVGCVGLAAASVGFLLPPVPWSFRMALAGELSCDDPGTAD